jgi:hypothetical protein
VKKELEVERQVAGVEAGEEEEEGGGEKEEWKVAVIMYGRKKTKIQQ